MTDQTMRPPSAPPTAPALGPLVGREREQAVLREALAAALGGRGSLVLIGGEAGIGKTAFAEWLLAEASERGALALVGRCYDLTETPPYGPWLDLFARYRHADLLPPPRIFAHPGAVGAVDSQRSIRDEVAAFFRALAARRPLALLLDDLHWADPASLDLLRFLARDLASLPVLIVAIYRTEELTRHHPLFTLLPVLVREAAALRPDLRPLDDPAVRALLRARYALADPDEARLVTYLQARAEGNPFFAGELLRTLEEIGVLQGPDEGVWALGALGAAGV